jgi:hypothetical protein
MTKITDALHGDQCTLMIISIRIILVIKKYFWEEKIVEKIKTIFWCPKLLPENSALYWIMWRKYCIDRPGHRWQYNTELAHCMLDN